MERDTYWLFITLLHTRHLTLSFVLIRLPPESLNDGETLEKVVLSASSSTGSGMDLDPRFLVL
jgi:hypothetical protein